MTIPPDTRRLAERAIVAYCDGRVPQHVRDEIRLEHTVRGDAIMLLECRPPWREGLGPEWTRHKVAQLRWIPGGFWRLYAYDRNARRIDYPFLDPQREVTALLAEIDADPTCIFWG